MSFQPLARSWRPRRFENLVGQAHVVRALSYALDHNQLHHALLFSGTRGVGKTTLARIIAKCLNCEHGVSSKPCPDDETACTACREIDAGRFVDLIEVDAASRTGVDDTRALMDNVAYAPTVGRTKVYLIDEVHMLSKQSFNALLKTFEEPPPNVEFVLATTEPEKIPVTILSRCLQFPLKRLPAPQITAQLRHVADAESLTHDGTALEQIAHAADGSMRDALSLVDQGLAFGGGRLDNEVVHEMLGTVAGDRIQLLVAAIVDADAATAMTALDGLYADGIDTGYIMDAVATAWQRIATIQIVGTPIDETDAPWQALAERADAGAVQVFYDIAIAGIRDLAYAPDPLVGTRMSILRMLAFEPGRAGNDISTQGYDQNLDQSRDQSHYQQQTGAAKQPPSDVRTPTDGASHTKASSSGEAREPLTRSSTNSAELDAAYNDDQIANTAKQSTTTSGSVEPKSGYTNDSDNNSGTTSRGGVADTDTDATTSQSETALPADWHALLERLEISGLSAQLAANVVCEHLSTDRIDLILAESRQFLLTPIAREGLENALAAFLVDTGTGGQSGHPVLTIRVDAATDDTPAKRSQRAAEKAQDAARQAIENDPFVNKLKERLGASVRLESIQPARDHRAND